MFRGPWKPGRHAASQAPAQNNRIGFCIFTSRLHVHTEVSEALLGEWRPAPVVTARPEGWGSEADEEEAPQVLLTFITLFCFPTLFQSVIAVFIYLLAYCFVSSRTYILGGSKDTVLFDTGSFVPLGRALHKAGAQKSLVGWLVGWMNE